MNIIRHLSQPLLFPHPVVSLGNFDGLHLGHQAIVRRLVHEARSRQGTALVLTFHPHTLAVLRPDRPPSLILGLREKLRQFAALGVQGVILQRFTLPFSRLLPEEFVQRYLVEALRAEKIIVGHNVHFGCKGEGRVETLQRLGPTHGFTVEVVGPIAVEGREVISSTAVRSLLTSGDVNGATRLLGRRYAVDGRVQKGFQRGNTIGFPTANLRPRMEVLLPNGVYAVWVNAGQNTLPGVANVGFNPTFGGQTRTVETHLFNFSGNLYGHRLRVEFVERLRDERKFPSVDELVRQIQTDAERARLLLGR